MQIIILAQMHKILAHDSKDTGRKAKSAKASTGIFDDFDDCKGNKLPSSMKMTHTKGAHESVTSAHAPTASYTGVSSHGGESSRSTTETSQPVKDTYYRWQPPQNPVKDTYYRWQPPMSKK